MVEILHENEPQNEGVFGMFALDSFEPFIRHFPPASHSSSPSPMFSHIILTTTLECVITSILKERGVPGWLRLVCFDK